MEETFQCELCRQRHTVFYCSHCISEQIQHRKTMLAGLQADVAVLRKKTEYALQIRQSLVEEETKLSSCMLQVEKLTQNVMKTREKLCEGIDMYITYSIPFSLITWSYRTCPIC
jgi:hypothetical protein